MCAGASGNRLLCRSLDTDTAWQTGTGDSSGIHISNAAKVVSSQEFSVSLRVALLETGRLLLPTYSSVRSKAQRVAG